MHQHLKIGDEVPDYGPGDPVFRVAQLDPPHALVYLTIRQPSRNWTWPDPKEPLPADALSLSWALVLEDLGRSRSRLHVRLRAKRDSWRRIGPVVEPVFRFRPRDGAIEDRPV